MNLYVVGESTPVAEDWGIWSEVKVVIAKDEESARLLAGGGEHEKVTQIPMNKEQILRDDCEPDWGDGL